MGADDLVARIEALERQVASLQAELNGMEGRQTWVALPGGERVGRPVYAPTGEVRCGADAIVEAHRYRARGEPVRYVPLDVAAALLARGEGR